MPDVRSHAFSRDQPLTVLHTGGAVGASSILLIMPRRDRADPAAGGESNSKASTPTQEAPPRGVVVAILCNMQGVGLRDLAMDIAREFQDLKTDGPYRVQRVYQC